MLNPMMLQIYPMMLQSSNKLLLLLLQIIIIIIVLIERQNGLQGRMDWKAEWIGRQNG